jgi:hypothetical protein
MFGMMALAIIVAPLAGQMRRTRPGEIKQGGDVEQCRESWQVLEPITRSNLSVYPVVSNLKSEAAGFLTLDEGVASGEIRIAERGQVENAIYRRRDTRRWPPEPDRMPQIGGPSVNELVLVNNSTRPLILLAGEVVSGGKQNRIIGADLIVPPKSDPLPLTVFCVEHGRWSAGSSFDSARAMAHPAIRMEAQAKKSQEGVWESVARSAAVGGVLSSTSSYLDVLNSPQAKRSLDQAASSIEADYERELRDQLRGRKAIGVVVAINGQLVWSDMFPSQELFEKYWPKLLRSYVLEAEGRGRGVKSAPSPKNALAFLLEDRGRVSVKVEPAVYRRTEVSADDYQIVALEALAKFEDSGVMMHYNKMARN